MHLIKRYLCLLFVPALAWGSQVSATYTQISQFLGGKPGILVFVDREDGGKVKWVDLGKSVLTLNTVSGTATCDDVILNKDGQRLVYTMGSGVYTCWLSGGSSIKIADRGSESNWPQSVAFWYEENNTDYIVYCDATPKDDYARGRTYLQKIKNGIEADGARTIIADKAYDGGITSDGRWLLDTYIGNHLYDRVNKKEHTAFYLSNGSPEGQTCNGSFAPVGYKMQLLTVGHQVVRVFAYNTGTDQWEFVQDVAKPPNTKEWQYNEYSLHPDYFSSTAELSTGGQIRHLYIGNFVTSRVLKVVSGNVGKNHLYLGSTAFVAINSFTASPGSITPGNSSTLSWSTTNAASVKLDGSTVSASGSTSVSPANTTAYTLTAMSADDTVTRTVTVMVYDPSALHIKINCGDNAYAVSGWEDEDTYATGGGSWTWNTTISTAGVTNAGPAPVYKSVRRDVHSYSIPSSTVPNGIYTLRLHFADEYPDATYHRAMTISAEGTAILTNFSPYAAAGNQVNKAVVKDFSVEVKDGNGLQIGCDKGKGNDAFMCGFEVIGTGSGVGNGVIGMLNIQRPMPAPSGVEGSNNQLYDLSGRVIQKQGMKSGIYILISNDTVYKKLQLNKKFRR